MPTPGGLDTIVQYMETRFRRGCVSRSRRRSAAFPEASRLRAIAVDTSSPFRRGGTPQSIKEFLDATGGFPIVLQRPSPSVGTGSGKFIRTLASACGTTRNDFDQTTNRWRRGNSGPESHVESGV